jgi:uncharacterized OsmC-like protein
MTEARLGPTMVDMRVRQAPLYALYKTEPEAATIVDRAVTRSDRVRAGNALGGEVLPGGRIENATAYGVHTAIGGDSDVPVPGEILCAAIAACLDSSIRIIANRLGLELRDLKVEAEARVDVRGTLRAARDVPVGFQSVDVKIDVDLAPGTPPDQTAMLLKAAEESCVVLQTLRTPPAISISTSRG